MVCILSNPIFRNTVWCKQIVESLTVDLKRYRIPFCELHDETPVEAEAVFVVTSDYTWTKDVLKTLNQAGVPAILINTFSEKIEGFTYSNVSFDLYNGFASFMNDFKDRNDVHLALYGVNTSSSSDIGKTDIIYSLKKDNISSIKMYLDEGSLQQCFDSFYSDYEKTDVVFCVNKFVAISLVHKLISCGKNPKALRIYVIDTPTDIKFYNDYLNFISINYRNLAQAAIVVFKTLQKNNYFSNISVTTALTSGPVYSKSDMLPLSFADAFHSSCENLTPEMNDIMSAEILISNCDDMDRILLKKMAEGVSTKQFLQENFLSEGGMRYRIERFIMLSGLRDKKEIIRVVKEYLYRSL